MRVRLGINKADADCVGHGLRAEYVENEAMLRGLPPPTLGGKAGQMSPEKLEQIQLAISANTGHNRARVLGSYFGSFRKIFKTEGRGGRIGNLIVDAERETIGAVYANPAPVKQISGGYRTLSQSEIAATGITVVIEQAGDEVLEHSVVDFFAACPDLEPKLQAILMRVGLGMQ